MKTIFLDPGHGGRDPGAVGYGLLEKNLNLKVARFCEDYLNAHYSGHRVLSSRDGDRQVLLQDIVKKARDVKADVLVSIHTNAGGGTGYETFLQLYPSQEETRLQTILHKEVYSSVYKAKFPDRGMKKSGSYYILRNSHCPAILSENLFIDTKKDVEFLNVENNLKTIGEAHAKGIAKFLNLSRKQISSLMRVQVGAYKEKENAQNMLKQVKKHVPDAFIVKAGDLYKVQAGAFGVKANAEKQAEKLRKAGFNTYIYKE